MRKKSSNDNGSYYTFDRGSNRDRSSNNDNNRNSNQGSNNSAANKKQDKKQAEKLVNQAVDLMDKKRYTAAEPLLNQALSIYPRLPSARFNLVVLRIEVLEAEAPQLDSVQIVLRVISLYSTLGEIVADDTSGRGEVTVMSYRSMANLISEYIDHLSTTLPTNATIRHPFTDISRFGLLSIAERQMESAIRVLTNENEVDEYYYDLACIKQQQVSAAINEQKSSNFSRSAGAVYGLVQAVCNNLQSALHSNMSNDVDNDVFHVYAETLNDFMEYLDAHAANVMRTQRCGFAMAIQAIISTEPFEFRDLFVESIRVAETVLALFDSDSNENMELLSYFADLLTSLLPWRFRLNDFDLPVATEVTLYSSLFQLRNRSLSWSSHRILSSQCQPRDNPKDALFLASLLSDVSHTALVLSTSTNSRLVQWIHLWNNLSQAYKTNSSSSVFQLPQETSDSSMLPFFMRSSPEMMIREYMHHILSLLSVVTSVTAKSCWEGNPHCRVFRELPGVLERLNLSEFTGETSSTMLSSLLNELSCFGFELTLLLWFHIMEAGNSGVFTRIALQSMSEDTNIDLLTFEEDLCTNLAIVHWRRQDEIATEFYVERALISNRNNTGDVNSIADSVLLDDDLAGIVERPWFARLRHQFNL